MRLTLLKVETVFASNFDVILSKFNSCDVSHILEVNSLRACEDTKWMKPLIIENLRWNLLIIFNHILFHHSARFFANETLDISQLSSFSNSCYTKIANKALDASLVLCFLSLRLLPLKQLLIDSIAFLVDSSITYLTINYWVKIIKIWQKATCAAKFVFFFIRCYFNLKLCCWIKWAFQTFYNFLPVPNISNSITGNQVPVGWLKYWSLIFFAEVLEFMPFLTFQNIVSTLASPKENIIHLRSDFFFKKFVSVISLFSLYSVYIFK